MHVIYLKFLSPQTFSLTYSLKLFQIIYFVVSTTFFLFTLNNGKSDHSLIHDQAIKRNGFNTEWKSQITLHCFFKELFWYKAACAVNWVLNPLLFLSWSLIKIIIIIHVCILQFFFFFWELLRQWFWRGQFGKQVQVHRIIEWKGLFEVIDTLITPWYALVT